MGRHVFKLPDIGEGIAEVEVVKWHAAEGDTLSEGQALVDLMTDKATVEIGAPVAGTLLTRSGDEGEKMAVGAELAVFETETSEMQSQAEEAPLRKAETESAPRAEPRSRGKVLAAPAVRARAKVLNIDLVSVPGSGPDGRVTHADLDALLLRRAPAPQETTPPSQTLAPPTDSFEEIKVFGLRRRIAERMLDSKRRIPHFTYVEEIDVTALEALRADMNALGNGKPRLTLLPFLIRAIANAVQAHPALNSHYDDASGVIRRFDHLNAGIATQTERGLLVPVIRHAETMDIHMLATEIARLSEAARAGKSERQDLTGSTITVTSLGALGGLMATPIINPPEVAIIGVNRIREALMMRDGQPAVTRVMNLSSSFDHRVIDGYAAAAFIAAVKAGLEAPETLLRLKWPPPPAAGP